MNYFIIEWLENRFNVLLLLLNGWRIGFIALVLLLLLNGWIIGLMYYYY
jgi:hypothetical protein